MKKITLLFFLIPMLQVVFAQEEIAPNKIVLGGSMNFLIQNNAYPLTNTSITPGYGGIYSNNTNDIKYTTFAINPYIGKEINPHLLFGVQLDYRLSSNKTKDAFILGQPNLSDFESKSNLFSVGIFSRHTINPGKLFNFYLQPYLKYTFNKEKESQNTKITQEIKSNYIDLGLGIGVLYNINDRMRATLRTGSINYVNGKWEIVDTGKSKNFSSFGTNLNLATIFFGFEIKI